MTTIKAQMIADSLAPHGVRLKTMLLRYPKIIHAEAKTHRLMKIGSANVDIMDDIAVMDDPALSRNASSSRAIPVARLIQDVIDDPVRPLFWGRNRPGMQAMEELTGNALIEAQTEYDRAMQSAIDHAQRLAEIGVHKQHVNRIIEPYSHINVLVSATDWSNFYALRRHPDAQPEIRALADAMWEAEQRSVPVLLQPGEWHLPFVDVKAEMRNVFSYLTSLYNEGSITAESMLNLYGKTMLKMSAARCARLSYMTHDLRSPTVAEDVALFDRLTAHTPLHASPTEHQATPDTCHCGTYPPGFKSDIWWKHPDEHGNFVGWRQHRKMLAGESVADR